MRMLRGSAGVWAGWLAGRQDAILRLGLTDDRFATGKMRCGCVSLPPLSQLTSLVAAAQLITVSYTALLHGNEGGIEKEKKRTLEYPFLFLTEVFLVR